jgi:hypothetical protein
MRIVATRRYGNLSSAVKRILRGSQRDETERRSATIRTLGRRVDSSFLLPSAARCLMKNVTRPNGRDEWLIEEATERGNETGTN